MLATVCGAFYGEQGRTVVSKWAKHNANNAKVVNVCCNICNTQGSRQNNETDRSNRVCYYVDFA